MKKIAVITANFGGIDSKKEIPKQTIDFDRYYFTEQNSPYDFNGLDNRLKAKYFKWQMHKLNDNFYQKYDVFVWIDANVKIRQNNIIEKLIFPLNENDISISNHPARNCIYEEAKFISDGLASGSSYLKARYNESIINEVNHYKAMGHPYSAGLKWCGLFAVKNNLLMNNCFDEIWNDQILRSNFDQNSFMFYALKNDIKMNGVKWGNFHKNVNYELIHHAKLM